MDLSDGLSLDLARLCRASNVSATLEKIPVYPGATLERALSGGEDYELLFTAAASDRGRIQGLAASLGVALTKIGTITEGDGVRVLDTQGRPVEYVRKGFQHF